MSLWFQKSFLEEAKDVDIAVIGEGEYAMLEIAQAFEGKKQLSEVLGIAYRQNGKVIVNPTRPLIENLDELPYPAYDLVDMEQYLKPKKDWLPQLPRPSNIDDYQPRLPL